VLGGEGDQELAFRVLELEAGDPTAAPADDVGVGRLEEPDPDDPRQRLGHLEERFHRPGA